MMKKLERKWKRIISWTSFICIFILVIIVKYRWELDKEISLKEKVSKASKNAPPHRSPSEPHKSVDEVSKEELSQLLEKAPESWAGVSAEKREKALISRVDELSSLEPERVEGIVTHLLELSGTEQVIEKKVEITEIDLDSSVPVNMIEALDENGKSSVVMTLQDKDGQVAEIWVDPEDMSEEEEQALRAFKMMNRVPALHKLRPILVPLMRD